MSGGVDSSVTAALLQEQGHDVIGVHMKLHDAVPGGSEPGRCCGLDDALDARRVADQLQIPFYVMNLREAFQKAVMDQFADDYLAGRTPNPCIHCNGVLKFRVMMARAMALGAECLATGHYCRVEHGPALRMAVDRAKDQSYFLFPITKKALERTIFPLGGMSKPEVRAHAERFGLLTAQKAESQDICFIPDDDHTRFVKEYRPDVDASGEIVDVNGRVLGYHDAYHRFTIGQRRGIGVALGYPAYVIRVEPDTKRVVVGGLDKLKHTGLIADRCNWFEVPPEDEVIEARIRHRGGFIPAKVKVDDEGLTTVNFLDGAQAVAPGQAAVFYRGERVLGGGWIRQALES